MQGVMWVIFGASLGLAQLVVHQRQLMSIPLDPRIRLGPVWVRLPAGWTITSAPDPESGVVQVLDPDRIEELTIAVQRLPDGQRGGQDADQPGAGTEPIYFNGLKRQGVMAELQQKIHTPDGVAIPKEMLLAVTDLPGGYELEILLAEGGGKMGAGEQKLMQTIANEITWAGPLPQTPRRPTLPRGPIQFY